MKHYLKIVLITLIVVLPTFVNAGEVKIALDTPPKLDISGSYVWAHNFGEALKSAGMNVRELPRGSIGGEAEKLDQLSTGLLEVSLSDVKSVGKIHPFIYGVRLPYIFEDVAHMDRVFEAGNLISKINKQIAGSDVKLVALVPLGPESGIINTKKAVHNPGDMADLRMRALDDAQISLYKAWGSNGTIVPWKEVPTALQTGVVDGYINSALVPIMFGHTDFIKYFTDAKVIIAQRAALVSKSWYDGLSNADRTIVDNAVAVATKANRDWLAKVSVTALEGLEAAGVKVVELPSEEREKFRKLSKKVYESSLLSKEQLDEWVSLANSTR
ncbi:MAG: TRAP transporter substrate-binding protein [Desulfobacterales bacterium]|jgi:TRAP-type C4-dicarboxylate transport system substrate-binding protein